MSLFEKGTLSIHYSGNLPSLPYEKIKNDILGSSYELSIFFASPQEAQAINKKHRNKIYVPNTLSFPATKTSGDLFICRSVARHEASSFGLTYKNYLIYLLIHSMLHLDGMDHGGTMEKAEAALMQRFAHTNEATHHNRH